MVDKAPPVASAKDALERADKIMPTLKVTESTRILEMRKVVDQVESTIPKIGPYARVYGEKGSSNRFAVFNEPVIFQKEGEGANEVSTIGLVFATQDGFKGDVIGNVKQSELEREMWDLKRKIPDLEKIAHEKGVDFSYSARGRETGVYIGGWGGVTLTDVPEEHIVVEAIETSIAKAQEGPKKSIAKNQQTIKAAAGAQASIARTAVK
ncbi:hypothetical protein CANDROIZ_620001 [Candidatus Roizmanbacteria bacterium]|nr:hypothetical protein CANDROIZ_620001 [Candidatus Roizmanbacteria bacterium]